MSLKKQGFLCCCRPPPPQLLLLPPTLNGPFLFLMYIIIYSRYCMRAFIDLVFYYSLLSRRMVLERVWNAANVAKNKSRAAFVPFFFCLFCSLLDRLSFCQSDRSWSCYVYSRYDRFGVAEKGHDPCATRVRPVCEKVAPLSQFQNTCDSSVITFLFICSFIHSLPMPFLLWTLFFSVLGRRKESARAFSWFFSRLQQAKTETETKTENHGKKNPKPVGPAKMNWPTKSVGRREQGGLVRLG